MIHETVKRNVVFTNLDNQVGGTGPGTFHGEGLLQQLPTSCEPWVATELRSLIALPGLPWLRLQLARLARQLPQGELAVMSRQLGGNGGSAAVGATSEGEEDLT